MEKHTHLIRSDEAEFLTGACTEADGGRCIQGGIV